MNPIEGIIVNYWILAFGGGVLSFTAVFIFLSIILSAFRQKKLHKLIASANAEFLSIITPLVIEKRVPNDSTMESIRQSVALKYGLKDTDLISNSRAAIQLIGQIMSDNYLRSDQKIDLHDSAGRLKSSTIYEKENEILDSKSTNESKLIAFVLSSMSAIFVAATTIFVSCKDPGFSSDFRNYIILLAISILSPIILLLIGRMFNSVGNREKSYIPADEKNDRKIDQPVESNNPKTSKLG